VFRDFNLPSIDWSGVPDSCYPKPKKFLTIFSDNGCVQLIDSPTRGKAFLDLVLTNDPLIISNVTVSAPFYTSDHNSILLFVISLTSNQKCLSDFDGVGTLAIFQTMLKPIGLHLSIIYPALIRIVSF